jgi:activating signal cointegrator complex subunit 3
MLRLLRTRPGAKIVYVAPLKALARERLTDWRRKLGDGLGLTVLELTGEVTPDLALLQRADVLVVTPEKWDGISRGWAKREYVQRVELVVIDEIHLLGVDRGPVLEVIVSRMRFIATQTNRPIRFVGLSTALANPKDLADWLGIDTNRGGMFNFRPSVRPIPMTIHIQGFAGKHYCPRMATMNKPTYAAILEHSPTKPALVFVSSRRQTRLTALDLISYCASDDSNPKKFLNMPEDEITAIAQTLKDGALRDTIVFGIGIHHAGLDNHDRQTVEELFTAAKIQVLVCTSTLAWGVNLPCHLVVVKGTEYFDGKIGRYVDSPVTDVLQMMGRAGRPQFDTTGELLRWGLSERSSFVV